MFLSLPKDEVKVDHDRYQKHRVMESEKKEVGQKESPKEAERRKDTLASWEKPEYLTHPADKKHVCYDSQ